MLEIKISKALAKQFALDCYDTIVFHIQKNQEQEQVNQSQQNCEPIKKEKKYEN